MHKYGTCGVRGQTSNEVLVQLCRSDLCNVLGFVYSNP